MDFAMKSVLAFKRLEMVADPNPAPPWPRHIREILRSIGLPVPERGKRIAAALVGQASEHLSDAERQRSWDLLHAAGIVIS
jgi:hypothetical protein